MQVRDSQRKACYEWERELRRRYPQSIEDIGLDGSKELIIRICDREQIPYPSLGDGRGRRAACYDPSSITIKLPKWARSPLVVCHELAHYIVGNIPWHGPEWAWAVTELWQEYCGIPKTESRKIGRQYKPRRVRFKRSS